MNGHINQPILNRSLDFLCEETHATDGTKRRIPVAVTVGFDLDKLNV
jgi:hypothetical protein